MVVSPRHAASRSAISGRSLHHSAAHHDRIGHAPDAALLGMNANPRRGTRSTPRGPRVGRRHCRRSGGGHAAVASLPVFPIQATLLIRRGRLVIGSGSYATNKIVEKGKRAVVTGMSPMLCISGRTHCILNRHCFVFRA